MTQYVIQSISLLATYARFRSLLDPAGGGRSAPGKSIFLYVKIGTAVPPGPMTTADVEAAGSPLAAKAIVADADGMADPLLGCADAKPVIDKTPGSLLPSTANELEEGAATSSDPITVEPPGEIEV